MTPALKNLTDRIHAGTMVLGDGAWGTLMQQMGLQSGDCPEEWNVTQPDKIRQIARDYLQAGADFCLTNTFGGTKYRLMRHGCADKVQAFNKAGVLLCREVADKLGRVVIASVGPTGEFVEPEGMLSRREMHTAFNQQLTALKEGGAEAVCIETMYVLEEALLAVEAARELQLYCIASMTFDATPEGFRTMLGTSAEECIQKLDAAGADVVGTNCGNGIEDMVGVAKVMRAQTKKPLIVKSNAGLPEVVDGKLIYHETPQMMAARLRDLKAIGVAVVGGCCGTTPEHTRAFRQTIDSLR